MRIKKKMVNDENWSKKKSKHLLKFWRERTGEKSLYAIENLTHPFYASKFKPSPVPLEI
jgi:hypothetical protein